MISLPAPDSTRAPGGSSGDSSIPWQLVTCWMALPLRFFTGVYGRRPAPVSWRLVHPPQPVTSARVQSDPRRMLQKPSANPVGRRVLPPIGGHHAPSAPDMAPARSPKAGPSSASAASWRGPVLTTTGLAWGLESDRTNRPIAVDKYMLKGVVTMYVSHVLSFSSLFHLFSIYLVCIRSFPSSGDAELWATWAVFPAQVTPWRLVAGLDSIRSH